MPDDDDMKLVTTDAKLTADSPETDLLTRHGLVKVSGDELMRLARMAQETKRTFDQIAIEIMTPERAQEVRDWRCGTDSEDGTSWRGVAQTAYDAWGMTPEHWGPPWNQLMGMALCQAAAAQYGENYMEPPWN